MADSQEPDVKDTRGKPRFVFTTPIDATYNAYPIRIRNISGSGAQIEHPEPLKLHSSAKLAVSVPRSSETITLRGVLVWSRLARAPDKEGKHLYRSGVKLDGQGPAVSAMVDRIITIYSGEEDRQSLDRKKEVLREKAAKDTLRVQAGALDSTWRRIPSHQRQIDPDKVLLIEQTLARLKKTPDDIPRFAGRARKALEKKGEGLGEPDEMLAVWEYLDRLVPLGMVVEVLGKKKK